MGWHWTISSIGGVVLRGQFRPICSVSWDWPDSAHRRWFHARMDRQFPPPGPHAIQNHCLHIHAAWMLGQSLRTEDASLNALADERVDGPFVPVTLADL